MEIETKNTITAIKSVLNENLVNAKNEIYEKLNEKLASAMGDKFEEFGGFPEKFATLPYTINYDNPLNEDGDTLLDILSNPNAELADANLSTEDTLKEKLLEMLNVLDNRERVIIEDYFGLSGNTRTLEDIGGDFSLTKERVRQIKEKALRKLRNETGSLFDYL